jgi:hypothetical protein
MSSILIEVGKAQTLRFFRAEYVKLAKLRTFR